MTTQTITRITGTTTTANLGDDPRTDTWIRIVREYLGEQYPGAKIEIDHNLDHSDSLVLWCGSEQVCDYPGEDGAEQELVMHIEHCYGIYVSCPDHDEVL